MVVKENSKVVPSMALCIYKVTQSASMHGKLKHTGKASSSKGANFHNSHSMLELTDVLQVAAIQATEDRDALQ